MEVTEEIIARFFKGQCSLVEANAVLRYLNEDPEAAGKYTGKKEWDNARSTDYPLPVERSRQMFARIKAKTFQNPPVSLYNHKWVIAAAVILIVAASLFIFKGPSGKQNEMVLAKKAELWQSVDNPSEKTLDLILKDGTAVSLGAHSTISYQLPFPATKRPVRLKGKAFFNVAKDKKRPFTVYSGNISTTALGTAFTIDSFTGQDMISIKLHEGKVLVKRLDPVNPRSKEQFYLSPSQELTYTHSSGAITINRFQQKGFDFDVNTTKGLYAKQTGVSISFDRKPLENVFAEIEKAYQINLSYPKEGLEDHYFTGKFNKTDSLDRVLRVIAQVNHLEITKLKSSYKITRK
jgi:transmembrane sensor